ncbi:MAG: YqgE/AlgH family protein [Rhodospirillaceae bacterium]
MSNTIDMTGGTIAGKCLIAMPGMTDPNFARAVVYICAHTAEGAMGLVINRAFAQLSFPDILEQLDIEPSPACDSIRVHFGGPVEAARGFVLHSSEYSQAATLLVNDTVALTATTDVLRAMADGSGPRRSLMALGYAGWSPGQLDEELKQNAWLTVDADEDLLFSNALESKWTAALGRLGIDPAMLSETAGHA